MPRRGRLDRAAQEALELEVEAEVLGRDRQLVGERHDDPLVEAARQRVAPGDGFRGERRVAGEQLVATVASERHRHRLPCEAGQEERRQHGRVGEGLVEARRDLRQHVEQDTRA